MVLQHGSNGFVTQIEWFATWIKWFCNADWMVQIGMNGFATWIKWFCNADWMVYNTELKNHSISDRCKTIRSELQNHSICIAKPFNRWSLQNHSIWVAKPFDLHCKTIDPLAKPFDL